MHQVDYDDAQVSEALARLAASLTDMSEVMEHIGDALVSSTDQRFLDGIGPDGTAWAPKSEATLEAYRRRNESIDFRPLWGPSKQLKQNTSHVVGADGSSVSVGSNLIYAAVQQFGATKGAFGKAANGSDVPWGDIPARPFLGISDDDGTNIVAAVEEWLGRIAAGD